MKQLFYLKSLLIVLLVLFAGGGISAADKTETIYFYQLYGNGDVVETVEGTDITITFNKGNNSNAPKYFSSGDAVRAYGGNYFTVTANSNKITKIVIGFGSTGDGSNEITTNVGTYNSNGTWTGNAESVTFTVGGSSGNRRIASIAVTYDFEQGQGTLDPQNSFTNATETATVGETYTVQEITTLSTGRKSYESSDESVATIDGSGNITLKKAGQTTITVTTAADATYKEGSASYTLIVSKGTPVLSFASENVTAYVGTDQNGPALTNPGDGAVTYEISDSEVATIQSTGYIHPLKEGTATVTATTAETAAWYSATASYTLTVEKPFSIDAEGTYEWVKDATTLAAGDELVFVYQSSDDVAAVMGNQQQNNFGYVGVNYAEDVTDKSIITIPEDKAGDATPILLEGSTGAWYFKTISGYLYAASSSSNHLKTTDNVNDNAKATITISDGNASVEFQGNNSRNIVRYNTGNSIFSCYASGQNPIQIYRKVNEEAAPTITFSPESGTEVNYGTQVTITARTATSITYSVNGGEAVTVEGTSATVTINTHTTITATATNDYGTSEEVTAEYTIHAESPAFTYDPAEYEITIGDDFTAPELGKAADYDGEVTYSSDNTEVAEVDAETGAVTVKGAGTATITATGTATEHYDAATASYTLTVKKQESSVSFAESVVEITYGDNYNKQAATAEGFSGDLVYTSSDESVVKFHGNNVIDVLKAGTVTITATAPATETTSESSATYTLKIYKPADATEGAAEVLNEDFSDCNGTNTNFGGSGGFANVPADLGWVTSYCQAGPGYLKLGNSSNAGVATSPTFSVTGEAPISFAIAPWIANNSSEDAKVTISLTNATFNTANGESTIELNTGNLTQREFTTFDQYKIVGNSDEVTITFSGNGGYDRFFLDNVVVGGGAQPAHEINLTFSSAGYLTWVATADIDFSQTEGVTAYKITEATSKKITMVEVDQVPAGEAVMLKGSGTVTLTRTTGVEALSDNKMLACTDGSVTGNGVNGMTNTDIYVLGNGKSGLGFYMLKGTLQAGKGYLQVSESEGHAKQSFIAFDITTGVKAVEAYGNGDDAVYNLQGIRVTHPQKGIYVKNGKKFVIK